ncbi:MAG: hypothetical protein ACOCPQ_00250 [Desulfosudaceae bacterium]
MSLVVLMLGAGISLAGDRDVLDGDPRTSPPRSTFNHADEIRPQPAPDDSPPDNSKFPVVFEVAPRLTAGKLYFDVTSNLPDEMLFMAAITDDMGIVNSVDTTLERTDEVLADGGMEIGPFPTWNKNFPSGEYTLYLYSYHPSRQPRQVREIIGEDGEKLTGPNVSNGVIVFIKSLMVTGSSRSR